MSNNNKNYKNIFNISYDILNHFRKYEHEI
jgi:hypothetical protein